MRKFQERQIHQMKNYTVHYFHTMTLHKKKKKKTTIETLQNKFNEFNYEKISTQTVFKIPDYFFFFFSPSSQNHPEKQF